ncbi:MAG: UDP-N-acetylmuramoyl-L-alanyl-D-glutamate--2,6-diaminopimelate ligase [Polyangiales bacterium]
MSPATPRPRGATLAELARELQGARVLGDPTTRVEDLRHDSREVRPGDLFAARRGQRDDGARFAHDALTRGAVAVLADRALDVSAPVLVVRDVERAMAFAASHVWGHPSWTVDVIGVTGTNGKTTASWLIEHALAATGARPGLLGTVSHRFGDASWPALHTTPEADDLARRFGAMRDLGATHAVMEVSSHALALGRVAAVRFRVAALTNITQDHLDFHGTFERYVAAKASLVTELGPGASVLNLDDESGRAIAARVRDPITYSARGAPATLRVLRGGAHAEGIDAEVATPEGAVSLRSGLRGAHNVENLLASMAVLGALEVPYARAAEALADAKGAPGRLERVVGASGDPPFDVLVDYAHTDDALARVLQTLRATTRGRVICVFGCGGDRDRAKRPRMGEAVARGADIAVLTTDNPRGEAPAAIAEDAAVGLRRAMRETSGEPARGEFAVLLDREEAIRGAIGLAAAGDVVLIAGKGHEAYQEVRGVRRPFDDRAVAAVALELRLARDPRTGEG